MSRQAYRKLLQATFNEDFDAVDQLNDQIGDVMWRDSGMLVAATFAIAVEERFASDDSLEAVRAFVREAKEDFAAADEPIKSLVAEGVVRAALGEDDLLDDIDPLEGMRIQVGLTHKIFAESGKTPEQINQALSEAETMLDEATKD